MPSHGWAGPPVAMMSSGHDPGQVDGHGPHGVSVADAVVIPMTAPVASTRAAPSNGVVQHDVGADQAVQGALVLARETVTARLATSPVTDLGGRRPLEGDGPGRVPDREVPGHPEDRAEPVEALDHEDGDVGRRVHADDGADELGPVDGLDPHLFGIADELRRGQDVAVVAEDDARSRWCRRTRTGTSVSATSSIPPGPGARREDRGDRRGQPLAGRSADPVPVERAEAPGPHQGHDAPSPAASPRDSADRSRWR